MMPLAGNVVRALSMTNELLELVPTHQRALGNRAYYQEEIQKRTNESRRKRGEDGTDDARSPDQVSFFLLRGSGGLDCCTQKSNQVKLTIPPLW